MKDGNPSLNRIHLIALFVVIFLISTFGMYLVKNRNINAPVSEQSSSTPPTQQESSPSATVSEVKIFLIALNDNGKSGEKIGCEDSVVFVSRPITPTQAPLKASIEQLLSIKDQNVDQFYNSLYQSELKLDKASIDEDGKATINLSGNMSLGGVCDNPRFKAQLEKTAMQFKTVNNVEIFINGTDLDTLLFGN